MLNAELRIGKVKWGIARRKGKSQFCPENFLDIMYLSYLKPRVQRHRDRCRGFSTRERWAEAWLSQRGPLRSACTPLSPRFPANRPCCPVYSRPVSLSACPGCTHVERFHTLPTSAFSLRAIKHRAQILAVSAKRQFRGTRFT